MQTTGGQTAKGDRKMDSIKTLGVAALTALTAMAFFGSTSAMAERTALCRTDQGFCDPGNLITQVHEVSEGKAKLLTSFGTIECNVLFSSTSVGAPGAPQIVTGNFSYSNCTIGGSSCTASEENGPSEIKVLREGTERASVTGEGLVFVNCASFINCSYNGVGLKGSAFGALFAGGTGLVGISEQTTSKEGGLLCPKTAKLDLTTRPLTTTYISS